MERQGRDYLSAAELERQMTGRQHDDQLFDEEPDQRLLEQKLTHHRSLLLRVSEVADELRSSRSYVYRLLQEGHLPKVTIGRSVRVPRDALEQWVHARTQEARDF